MNRVEDLIVYGKKHLHSHHAKILLSNLLGLNPLELLNHLEQEVSEDLIENYEKQVEALKENKPIQYVIGKVNFYGNDFIVNEKVLIPRFETEQLVENTISYINEMFNDNVKIIDLGTGSGCIGLTLKSKLPNAEVTLLDISKEALEVAKLNASNLGLEVNFILNDMLENINNKYDVIISNPPYIGEGEDLEELVKNNEPSIALYGGVDGLECYKKILKNIKRNLNEKYLIAFEIGKNQGEEVKLLIEEHLENVEVIIKEDYQEKARMVFAYRK